MIKTSLIIEPFNKTAVEANLTNKGLKDLSPSQGCCYIAQPPAQYQELFKDLQTLLKTLSSSIGLVPIPHATIIAAKVVDLKPNQSWENAEEIQRIYQYFLLSQLHQEIGTNQKYIPEIARKVLNKCQNVLAKIASCITSEEALNCIEDPFLRSQAKLHELDENLLEIQSEALKSINSTQVTLSLESVKVTSNGSIIFQLTKDPKMVDLRINLIVAGQGIAKWPNLLAMENGWSTVGYFTQISDDHEVAKINKAIENWYVQNTEKLGKAQIVFNSETLGSIGFRANDCSSTKSVNIPVAEQEEIRLEDLKMSPKVGRRGITPIPPRKNPPQQNQGDWTGRINQSPDYT